MSWLPFVITLIVEILKLIFAKRLTPAQKAEFLTRMRAAKKKAKETGDTSELEALVSELAR